MDVKRVIWDEDFTTKLWPLSKIENFCDACASTVNMALNSTDENETISNALRLCIEYDIGTDIVCEGLVNEYAVIFIFVKTALKY